MWLIALMILLMVPMTFAALVYLLVAAWRALDALLQGTIGAVRFTWRMGVWSARMIVLGTRTAQRGAQRLQNWHHAGTTWSGQYLQASWLAWSNLLRRRYIAGQLRHLRRRRAHPHK